MQSVVASFYHRLVLLQKVVFVNLIPKYVRWVSESVLTARHHTDHQWVILKQHVPHRVAGKHTSQLFKKKIPTHKVASQFMFVFLLEKQNVKTSMYILECRSTEPNRTAGLGRASPHPYTHTRTHAHAQTEDRNTAKDRPPSPLKWNKRACMHTASEAMTFYSLIKNSC